MQKQRIQKYYKIVVAEDLLIAYNYTSIMQLPRLTHTTLNTTSKKFLSDKNIPVYTFAACLLLTGQKSIPSRAKNSISGFNLRKASLIGCKVTLRGKKMYNLIDKLLTLILPRVQDSWREEPRVFRTDNKNIAVFLTAFLAPVFITVKNSRREGAQFSKSGFATLTPAQVAHIGVSNFLSFPEVETFFSSFGSVGEFAGGNPIQGFDLTSHFSIPKSRVL